MAIIQIIFKKRNKKISFIKNAVVNFCGKLYRLAQRVLTLIFILKSLFISLYF